MNMREIMKLVEAAHQPFSETNLPEYVYHGTCTYKWNATREGSTDLYVTVNEKSAANYAMEWHGASFFGDDKPTEIQAIVVAFKVSDLIRANLTLSPNEETVDQCEDGACEGAFTKPCDELTWLDTMNFNGTFCVKRFPESMKSLGTIKNIGPAEPYNG